MEEEHCFPASLLFQSLLVLLLLILSLSFSLTSSFPSSPLVSSRGFAGPLLPSLHCLSHCPPSFLVELILAQSEQQRNSCSCCSSSRRALLHRLWQPLYYSGLSRLAPRERERENGRMSRGEEEGRGGHKRTKSHSKQRNIGTRREKSEIT